MIFLGVDAAWGNVNETGVLALDVNGTILDAGWTIGVNRTLAWINAHAETDTVVFIDAPLLVTNELGQRACEKQVGQRYGHPWKVSANSTNRRSLHLGGVALREALAAKGFRYDDGLDGPPESGRAVSECYPYTTIVGYEPFGYSERPRYKRGPKKMRAPAFRSIRARECDGLIRRLTKLADADPPLDLGSNDVTRKLSHEKSPLNDKAYKHREDLLDAAVCAWTASLWHRHGYDACQVLGGDEPGLVRPAATIIAPARPTQRGPARE